MKDKISMRQAGILVMICLLANKLLILPSLMFQDVKSDAIFSIILLFAFEFLALPIFFKLKRKYPNEKLFNIIAKFLSKVGAKIIFLVLLAFMLFKSLLTFSIVYDYFKQHIYQDEFIWIALICIVPVMSHAALTGLRPTMRTMELLFNFVLVGIFICFFISFFTHFTVPFFFVSTAKQIFSGTYKYIFTFGDFIFLFLFIDKIDYKRKEEKKIYTCAIIGVLIVLILFFIFYSKYQITAFMHNNALADILVFSVQFNAIGRLDIIAMATIMTVATFEMEIFCLGFCESFTNIFPLLNKKWAVVVYNVSFLLMYYLYLGKYEVMIHSTITWLPVLGVVITIVLPVIFLIFASIRRKNE